MMKSNFIFIFNIILFLLFKINNGMCLDNQININENITKENDNKIEIKEENKNKIDNINTENTKNIDNTDKMNIDNINIDNINKENIKIEKNTENTNIKNIENNIDNKNNENDKNIKNTNDFKNNISEETKKTNTEKKKYNDLTKYKSLMFSKKNIDEILKVLPRLDSPDSILNNSLFEKEDESQLADETNNIAIYLNSIMYISNESWAVWLNGNKITNLNNNDGEIRVFEISPLNVSFIWSVDNTRWNIINKNKSIPEEKYKIKDNGVDIYFSLSPNQTFIPSLNKTIEGKINLEDTEEKNNNDNILINENKEAIIPEDFSEQDNLFF